MTNDGSSRPRSLRLVAAAAWVALVPGLWLAHGKATRHDSPREIAARQRISIAEPSDVVRPAFREVAFDLGIVALHDNDARGKYHLPEEIGPGVGLFDFDVDGDLDVLVAGGGSLVGDGSVQTAQLWRNDGDRFLEVASEVGAAVRGPAYGVACADYDDDGDVDVFMTRLGANVLLRNEGGRFVDVSADAGVGDEGFGASAAFFDYDGDGWLDLYVTNYVDWSPERERDCFLSGVPDYCDPISYEPAQDRLYRNLAGSGFEDVTERAGIQGHVGNGLGVVADDFDGDGLTDLYVANDSTPAMLWRNRGDGTFEDASLRMGCAYNYAGVAIAGMGIACEDLDADGRLDLLVTNIHGQSHLVMLGEGERFTDATLRFGMPAWSVPLTGFGVALFDQDHDGALDVYVTNGGVNLTPERIGEARPYSEPDQFARLREGRFVDATHGSGSLTEGTGRGLASGDLDADGDLDLVVANNGGQLRVLRNLASGGGEWLIVDVRRTNGGPAIGAEVTLRAGDAVQRRTVRPQASFLSSSDPRVHFGLGDAVLIDELVVRWPDGEERTLEGVGASQVLVVPR